MTQFSILSCFAAVLILSPVHAGTLGFPEGDGSVFLQPPNQSGGPASDTEHYFGGVPSWSNPADDITLADHAEIVRLRWWSFYGGSFDPDPQPPLSDEVIRITFYAPRPMDGLPGDVLYEESFLNLPRIPTGLQIAVGAAPDEYLFEADLSTPFEMQANQLYWLAIQQVGDIDSYHRWEAAPAFGGSYAFRSNFFPEWQYVSPRAVAFELMTIPEPTLLGAILVFTLLSRGRERYKERNPR